MISIIRISIISAENGIEIYNRNFEPSFFLEHDEQLISGFISALIQFSLEIVKDEMRELIFSNSKLTMTRSSRVIIVLMTSLGTDENYIHNFIENLRIGMETPRNLIPARFDKITPELSKSIDKFVDNLLEKDVEPSSTAITRTRTPKIVIAGLQNVGKTTSIRKFFDTWEKEQLQTIKPTVDYSISNSFLDVLRSEITLFDLGGQQQYIAQHLTNAEKWKGAAAIIFMVDILQPTEFLQAYGYLVKIIEILKSNREEPYIALFAHKYDPEKISKLRPNLHEFLKVFQGIAHWPRYSIFLSSIFDDSLNLAFMRTLSHIIPRDLFKTILESAIFFETQNKVWETISTQLNLNSGSDEFREKIISLAIPYGENLANKIFSDWLSRSTENKLNKSPSTPIIVDIIDMQGSFAVSVRMPSKENVNQILAVIDGLLVGLGNVFGISSVERTDLVQDSDIISASWKMSEF